jgi:hypothetical protein
MVTFVITKFSIAECISGHSDGEQSKHTSTVPLLIRITATAGSEVY